MTKTVRMKETTDIPPAEPNKNRKRRVEQDTLLSRQLRKKNPTSSVLSFPVFIIIFFPLRAFLFQICHSFLLSTLSSPCAFCNILAGQEQSLF